MIRILLLLITAILLVGGTPAHALHPDCNVTMPCDTVASPTGRGWGHVRGAAPQTDHAIAEQALPHPAGCPRRAFCGCGAAVDLLGAPVRALWVAANWLKMPRAAPAPEMAAARRHHVMVLKQHIGGSVWLVADYNSGGGRSRLHARSISGFTVVNPRG